MAQISVTISDETDKLLSEIAQATGLTKSSLAAEVLRRGLYEEAEKQSKVANFRQQVSAEPPGQQNTRSKKK